MSPATRAARARPAEGPQAGSNGLVEALRGLAGAAGERMVSGATSRIGGTTDRLARYAERGGPAGAAAKAGAGRLAEGASPMKAGLAAGLAAVKERVRTALGRSGGGAEQKLKVTNIVESIEVGVPRRVAYDQWTRFEDFPRFMKKVEHVERNSAEEMTWKAQVFWSHRSWRSRTVEQVPDERIVWRSTGAKGSVDGAVTFHEITPELTRILLVLEYHPQGLFERTGNLWRAQGRRVRLELKHFARHVMTQTILHPDEVRGWRGEIRDGQVVRDDDGDESTEKPDRSTEKAGRSTEKAGRTGTAGEGAAGRTGTAGEKSGRTGSAGRNAERTTRRRSADSGADKTERSGGVRR
ncbi:SRPBCC family protein [Plantactinospora endophytica]|uniref:Polyketide cyclase n=1 Tax=Plantactinospora endophytica TaxID=673535 RepID=A0ABQ4EF05_9ACTN|nr:SRPBCC family protein [Plantactinospora endophytica]GIG92822.1 polyketide cyclase [Plantactinospora endophytica]